MKNPIGLFLSRFELSHAGMGGSHHRGAARTPQIERLKGISVSMDDRCKRDLIIDLSMVRNDQRQSPRLKPDRQLSKLDLHEIKNVVAAFAPLLTAAIVQHLRRDIRGNVRPPCRTCCTPYGRGQTLRQKSGNQQFDESKHPRAAAGQPNGGQFVGGRNGAVGGGSSSMDQRRSRRTRKQDLGTLRPSKLFPAYLVAKDGALIDPESRQPVRLAGLGSGSAALQLLMALWGDYRRTFIDSLPEAAKAEFDSSWQVHHRYQQAPEISDLKKFFKIHMSNYGIQDLDNLVGAPQVVHSEITNLQNQFWEDEFDRLVKKGKIDPAKMLDRSLQGKIKAVLKNSGDGKQLFSRYQSLVKCKRTVNHRASRLAWPRGAFVGFLLA